MAGVYASALGWMAQEPFGSDAPSVVEQASGDATAGLKSPAYGWITIIVILAFVRLLYESGEGMG